MPNSKRLTQFIFCPLCGSRFTTKKIGGRARLWCTACGFVFYQNAKPAASALIIREGKVLLVKRAVDPQKGWWDVPGGFVEEDEDPESGMKRELREELGVGVARQKLLGIFPDIYYSNIGPTAKVFNVYYLVELKKGRFKPADDITAAKWFPLHRPPTRIAFQHIRKALRAWGTVKFA